MFLILFTIVGGLFILVILILVIYIYKRFTLTKDIPFYPINKLKNPVLTIGIIGDSWATFGKLDNLLHQELLNNGFENRIISSGHSGSRTSGIYQNLFKVTTIKNSCKSIIESNPDYCILLAGTNDAIGHMGGRYYSFHMIKIIRFLLHYNIVPIVLSLPKIGILEINNTMGTFHRYRNRISAFFTNNNQFENVDSYRKVLSQNLRTEQLDDKILLIDFDKACDKYENGSEFYKNPIHLSNKGNEKLAGFIADELAMRLRNKAVSMH